jgi:hypothetical protein
MMGLTPAVLSLVLLQAVPGSAPRQLAEALTAVSLNVKESEDLLPDFLCNERVTSTTFKSGKKQNQKVVESIFSIRKSRESREILSIDGKPARKGAKMPRLPVNISGSFNFMINTTFSPALLQWYEFALKSGTEADRLVVRFETKKDQKEMIWNINGDSRAAHDTGQAWIDTSSMQVARIERNLLNLGRYASVWKITIDQAPFTIGERQFWLPKMFLTEITERDPQETGTFLAEYSNCKKFTTDITIRPLK